MNKIKLCKESGELTTYFGNKKQTWQRYKLTDIPVTFGCINFNAKEGVSNWFNYKGLTYIKK